MAEQFANNASTYATEIIFEGQLTFTVANASMFPTEGDFRILVENEYMLVTAVDGNEFTVERGIEGTTDVDHPDLVDVLHVLTAGALYALGGEPSPPIYDLVPLSNGDPDEPYIVFDSEGQVILVEVY